MLSIFHRSFLRYLPLVAALFVSSAELRAQWTNVAPGLIPNPGHPDGGCIEYAKGIAWAGTRKLFLSKDDGLTWVERISPVSNNDVIRHIDFWDDSIGVVAGKYGDVFLTTDQGVSWKRIGIFSSAWSARFVGSAQNIIVATGSLGALQVTTDQGKTWTAKYYGSFAPHVVPLKGGSAYALIGTGRLGAQLFLTTDYGMTWAATPDSAGYDSYTFAADPCSPERVYVANEDAGGSPNNAASEIFVTSDAGNDWKVTYTGPIRDIVGSITVASNAIYAQRMSKGILRSTDFGNTWEDVGGPSVYFDSRLIFAITDNLVLAADAAGNIWRTTNGGGDSVHGEVRISEITSTPDALFIGDTLYSCDPPTFDSLFINAVFCVAPRIARWQIEGDHPQDFTLTSQVPAVLTGADTITFRFMPRGNGERRANLRLVLEDSSTIIVPMRGFGKGLTELNTTTAHASTDTLGAIVYLPIRYESAGEMTGLAMQISYSSDQIEFVDAYDLLGASVANPTATAKRMHLTFPGIIAENGLIGHAAFRVYSGDTACLPVIFDSIVAISSRPPCAFAINPTMQAEICVPVDCVAQHVSEYLRYGNLPKLELNQIGRDLLLTGDKNFGDVSIRVVSTLGVVEATHSGELRSDKPVRFSIEGVPSGLYFVEVRSALGVRVVKIAINN